MSQAEAPTIEIDSTEPAESIDLKEEELSKGLNRINPTGIKFKSDGENVGWQNKSGETVVEIANGRELLQKLTPDSPWNLEAELGDKTMRLRLSHHDSPTGETHELTALEE